jgi:GT2 family glycosyltransferase
MKIPGVLVVIPFKGRIDLLQETIKSLTDIYVSGMWWSLILWDDGSTDEELNTLWNLAKRFLIVKHENVGYTNSVYNIVELAKRDASFDFLLLCNSDVKLHLNTMYSLLNRALKNPNIAVVGCKVLHYGKDIIQHTGTRLVDGAVTDPYVGLHKDDPSTKFVERRLWVNGCCALYSLDILRKENLNFSLEFAPAYFEEADLMTQLNLMGYSVLYEPKAIVEHFVGGTMHLQKDKFEPVFWQNWEKYQKKWKKYFNSKQLQF